MNISLTAISPSEEQSAVTFDMPDPSQMSYNEEDLYFPTDTRVVMTIIFAVLSIIGILGNILVITVVLKVKGMKTPTNCYLVSLAAADALFFVATSPTELSYLHLAANEYVFGSLGCAIFTFLPYLAINCSSLSITAFTIERFIGICYPYRARSMCTVSRATHIITGIWIFSVFYNSPWLYLATVVENDGQSCTFKLARDSWTYKMMYMGDFLAFYSIPMILNIIIYVKIALALSQCGDKMKHSIKLVSARTSTDASPLKETSDFHISGSKRQSKGRNQVVKMLAVVVIVFAACWLPYRAMVMHNSFTTGNRWDSETYIFFSKTMIFINCAINPILYNLMSLRFRNAFRQFLSGKNTLGRGFTSKRIVTTASQHAGHNNNNNYNNNYNNNGSMMDHRKMRESMSAPHQKTKRETDSMLFDTTKSEATVADV